MDVHPVFGGWFQIPSTSRPIGLARIHFEADAVATCAQAFQHHAVLREPLPPDVFLHPHRIPGLWGGLFLRLGTRYPATLVANEKTRTEPPSPCHRPKPKWVGLVNQDSDCTEVLLAIYTRVVV